MSELKDPRVLFAAERTLLAWNRTSLSLMAFGFVVERARILIQAMSPNSIHAGNMETSFWLGLAFIALGTFTSGYSARQYAIVLRSLTPAEFPPRYAARWGIWGNLALAAFGMLLALILFVWR